MMPFEASEGIFQKNFDCFLKQHLLRLMVLELNSGEIKQVIKYTKCLEVISQHFVTRLH